MSPLSSYHSHLTLAHSYWRALLKKGDTAIDATCGRGKDTLVLAKLITSQDSEKPSSHEKLLGKLLSLDLQPEALASARLLLQKELLPSQIERVSFLLQSHAHLQALAPKGSVNLIVYNLGYLPGGDKSRTTMAATTLLSVKEAIELIAPQGAISITCYPGHLEGKKEQEALLHFASSLDSKVWSVCHHVWLNRPLSPTLLFLQKNASHTESKEGGKRSDKTSLPLS